MLVVLAKHNVRMIPGQESGYLAVLSSDPVWFGSLLKFSWLLVIRIVDLCSHGYHQDP